MAEDKIDFKKKLSRFYNPGTIPEMVTVPPMQFLMIDGKGLIGNQEFQDAIVALFSVSFKAKFIAKKTMGLDYTVMPLEGLWWADDMNDFVSGRKERWNWTLMIMQPEEIDADLVKNAIDEVKKKKGSAAVDLLRFERLTEGTAVQIMHIGPFSDEHANIMRMHAFIKERNGRFDGTVQRHHEIYLSDFRKVAPAKMRTILRQPFLE